MFCSGPVPKFFRSVRTMRNVKLGVRWAALAAVAFFVMALATDRALGVAVAFMVVTVVAVTVVAAVDLTARRR